MVTVTADLSNQVTDFEVTARCFKESDEYLLLVVLVPVR
jgi:hypothetical protein